MQTRTAAAGRWQEVLNVHGYQSCPQKIEHLGTGKDSWPSWVDFDLGANAEIADDEGQLNPSYFNTLSGLEFKNFSFRLND